MGKLKDQLPTKELKEAFELGLIEDDAIPVILQALTQAENKGAKAERERVWEILVVSIKDWRLKQRLKAELSK